MRSHIDIEVFQPHELSPSLLASWANLQEANRALDSAYFRPEFTQAVASVRGDVEVAVCREGGEPVGFFPYQRSRRNIGKPVSGRLSDFQGVIAVADTCFDVRALIEGCRLSNWSFDHLIAAQASFAEHHWSTALSPFIDLSGGFEAYRKQRREGGTREVDQGLRKSRKVEREVGPLRLEARCDDPQIFETLLRWKSEQYRRTGLTDVFAYDWVVELLRHIWRQQSPEFGGMLSAVFVGDRLLAAHFGMYSRGVLHYWFPAYDRELMKYSPGLVLMLELCQAAKKVGVRRIDLGKGSEQFKTSLMTGATTVAEGAVESRRLARIFRKSCHQTVGWIRSSRLYGPARIPAGWVRPLREWFAFR
jgi:CelD/BcsL family acetyltransferase involved in cellulose biosynthesis